MKKGELISLEPINAYCERRIKKHGSLYIYLWEHKQIIEAKSIATGAVISIIGEWIEDDGG